MNEHKPTQRERILNRLRQGEVTNVELNNEMHIYRYGARILELRNAGHNIVSIKHKGGLWSFRLEEPMPRRVVEPEPQLEEAVQVQLLDVDPRRPQFVI